MTDSAPIADPLLQQACGRLARPSAPLRTVGACPRLRCNGTGTAAGGGASPSGSARRSRDAAQRLRDEPS